LFDTNLAFIIYDTYLIVIFPLLILQTSIIIIITQGHEWLTIFIIIIWQKGLEMWEIMDSLTKESRRKLQTLENSIFKLYVLWCVTSSVVQITYATFLIIDDQMQLAKILIMIDEFMICFSLTASCLMIIAALWLYHIEEYFKLRVNILVFYVI
jgi:hypothetical protein